MMDGSSASWTDERVALLSRLWGEGLSASQIAAALGGGVTRNAVIGKVHRLGLSGRGKAAPSAAAAGKPLPGRVKPAATPVGPVPDGAPAEDASAGRIAGTHPPLPDRRWAHEGSVPAVERVTILELRDTMCRWPLGDPTSPDFGFCGTRTVTGLPYCAQHCRMAYQPAAERKRIRA